jgi:hypothetical protein
MCGGDNVKDAYKAENLKKCIESCTSDQRGVHYF